MSGTSLDGIDAAIVKTDGVAIQAFGLARTYPYPDDFRRRLRDLLGRETKPDDQAVVVDLTLKHADAVISLLADNALAPSAVDVIGFHGQTVLHQPERGITRQVGDAALLASRTGIRVVADFRSRDVAAGGQGAPLVPLFHQALARDIQKPLAVLNLGGVGNVTYLGPGEPGDQSNVIAFDTGPGNALIDDWIVKKTGRAYDADGGLAASGRVDEEALRRLLDHDYFARRPPKSLDRNDFNPAPVAKLSAADGAATLTAFSARSVGRAVKFLPRPPRRWLVAGGGRHNRALMRELQKVLGVPVDAVESAGWRGDDLEAQAFAFLAVRSLYALPISLPTTTGVPRPMTGGTLHKPGGR
ncbi:MAG: anhydro-N-acetylmuramic acid kinase [Rhodospirillales bacterium]|nr:anhydro-N-acetylmuramic acid kinase [Rhodospirillales bacterium]